MADPTIRPMTNADIQPAAALLERGDWGPYAARLAFFDFAVRHANADPIVAAVDGQLVGTGVGTANGRVGWVGTIFVDRSQRGRGLGRALTEAVIERLDARGCTTLLLVATELGRPVYTRLGFAEHGWYQTFEADGLAAGAQAADPAIGPLSSDHLPAMAELDALATGEDRSLLLADVLAAAGSEPGWALAGASGGLGAFLVRPPWGGGATIARSVANAMALLEHRRRLAGPERRVRAGVLAANADGAAGLRAAGWSEGWRAIRMIRGEPLSWRPEMIWGQFSFALG